MIREKSNRDKFEGLKKHWLLRVQSVIIIIIVIKKKNTNIPENCKKAPKQKPSSIHMYAERDIILLM